VNCVSASECVRFRFVCVHIYAYVRACAQVCVLGLYVYVCMYVCGVCVVCVCAYVCVHIPRHSPPSLSLWD